MNTHDASRASEAIWTPIVASHETCSECFAQPTATEAEFVHRVLDQHSVDMTNLADEIAYFVGEFLHLDSGAVSAA